VGGADRPGEGVVARNFLALGGGDALARIIAFGATAYLTRILGAAGYGVIAVAAAVALYLSQIAHFGIDTLGIREVAEDRSRAGSLGPPILTLRVAYTTVVVAVLATASWLAAPAPDGPVVAIFLLALVAQAASAKWIHLGLESAAPVGLSRIGAEVLTFAVILAFVRSVEHLWIVAAANVLGEVLSSVLMLAALRKEGLRFRWAPREVMPIFGRALPIVGHSLLGLLIYNSDLLCLRIFRSNEEVGLYAAGYTLISFLINLGVAYGTSLLPTLTRLGRGTDEERALYQSAHAQVLAASMPIALGGSMVAASLMAQIFGETFAGAGAPLQILLWSVPVSLIRNVAIAALVSRSRQDQMLKTTIYSAILCVILNVALIPRYGLTGAAVATLATELLRTALALIYTRSEGLRFTPMKRHWKTASSAAAMMLALLGLRQAGYFDGFFVWAAIAGGGLTYVLAMALVGGLRFEGRPRLVL
jgi:O-antigen/teichoic acid export membrane protein